ncbi:energy transducer TonB [Spirosoma sp. 209]|uniref:energy transducer TonB n=1 Tax=Spirosoma sp. 209 TaxID=1955701 RepID=UPI00098D530F|nr:energy transducer TonB [Spirosoma sp. 209]
MKLVRFFILLLIPACGFCQWPVYKSFEVDTAARPQGGPEALHSFLLTNFQMPLAAGAAGLSGRIILGGIAEPDGQISNAIIIRGLRPDCDREALRVFKLFNAWKPALKAGQPVRQEVVFPLIIKAGPPLYEYADGQCTTYLDEQFSPVQPGSSLARYKEVSHPDSTGLPTGDAVIYERHGKRWAEKLTLKLVREEQSDTSPDGQLIYRIGLKAPNHQWQGQVYDYTETGRRIAIRSFTNGNQTSINRFDQHGMLVESEQDIAQSNSQEPVQQTRWRWYSNGQQESIATINRYNQSRAKAEKFESIWDASGKQMVAEGNGRAIIRSRVVSRAPRKPPIDIMEEGSFTDGFRDGVWTGRYADGSFFYEDRYDKGEDLGGKAVVGTRDTLRYAKIYQPPSFKGGMAALGDFLNNTLRYPAEAQRRGVQGRVVIGFVISEEGAVDDITVIRGLGYGTDEEAARVVKWSSSRWTPGYQRGQPVRVTYVLPINFSL